MPYSEAQKRASRKYNETNYVQLAIRMKPEEKEAIMQAAEAAGLSVRQYLLRLVEADREGVCL